MALQGPFAVYLENGAQVLKPLPKQSGGGNGNTIINTSGGVPVLGVQTLTDPGSQIQGILNRNLLVLIRYATDGTVILPPLGSFTVGATITLVRTASPGIPTIVTNDGADQVNGVGTGSFTPYQMRSLQDSVVYMRVPNGWTRDQGDPVPAVVASGVTPIVLDPRPEGTQYVFTAFAGAGSVNLPLGSLCRIGYRVVIVSTSVGPTTVTPAGTDTIDAVTTPYIVQPGGTAIIEYAAQSGAIGTWISVSEGLAPNPGSTGGALVPVAAWRGFGQQNLELTGLTAQTVELPTVAGLRIGASILISNNSSDSALVVPDGTETINGQDRRTILKDRSCLLVSNGTAWQATDGGRYTSPQTSATDPAPVPAWVDSPLFFECTNAAVGHVIRLPNLGFLQYGAFAVIFNNSAEAASLQGANGLELINGAASFAIAANTVAVVWKRDANNWIAMRGA